MVDKSKKNKIARQNMQIFFSFYGEPCTLMSVAYKTGIEKDFVCRCVSEMLKCGRIVMCKEGIDPITKCITGFYSTDPKYFPIVDGIMEMTKIDVCTLTRENKNNTNNSEDEKRKGEICINTIQSDQER